MPDDMREAISAAFDAAEKKEEEKVESTVETKDETVVEEKQETKGQEQKEETKEGTDLSDRKAGDEGGETDKKDDKGEQEEFKKDEKPGDKDEPPKSWRAAAREKWKSIDPEIKAEIRKREADIQKKFNDTNGRDGQFARQFEQVVAPFQHYISANGGNALGTVQNLMRTGAVLHGGTKAQKVQIVKQIIGNFDIDIEMLDKALAGELENGKSADDNVRRAVQEEIKPIKEFVSTLQSSQAQRYATEAQKFFEENEFASDVAEEMADLMEIRHRRGQQLTYKEAYDIVCRSHPEISKILDDRAKGASRQRTQEDIRKKEHAASSVAGKPAGVKKIDNANLSLRDTLSAAFDLHNGR